MFNALIDFAEELAGFKILHTTQSISLHVCSLMLDLQHFSNMMTKFTLMGVHSQFTLVIYAKKHVVFVLYIKTVREGNQLNFKLQMEV